MRTLLVVILLAGSLAAQDVTWDLSKKLDRIESKVTALDAKVVTLTTQTELLTQILARMEAKQTAPVTTAVATPAPFTPAALNYATDCPSGQCGTIRVTSARPVAAVNTSWTGSPVGEPTYTVVRGAVRYGNTDGAARTGPVRGFFRGFASGCGSGGCGR